MSLQIDIDPHGEPRVPFTEMRHRLQVLGRRFTAKELDLLPYGEIVWAATPRAGTAACGIEAVRKAKRDRRERFLNMSPEALVPVKAYLQREGVYQDISAALQMRGAPHFGDLNPLMKLWLKLNCLYTHVDAPEDRLRDVFQLLRQCAEALLLSEADAARIGLDLDRLAWLYPVAIDEDQFRTCLGGYAEEVLDMLEEDDKAAAHREHVADYNCTSHCYHAWGPCD